MTLPQLLARSADAMTSQVGDETVILHVGSGTYFGLDPVGTRIWTLIETPQSVESLTKLLLSEFDVPANILEADIRTFLEDLHEHGIVIAA